MTTRDIVVAGALPRQQVREWLKANGIHWSQLDNVFTITASDEQWGQIQEWVKKVTG